MEAPETPCSFPCLLLKGHLSGNDGANRNIPLQDIGALSLAEPLKAGQSNIDHVPMQLLKNVTLSFRQLLCSRLRASMTALIRTTIKLGDYEKANVLRRLLSSRESLRISTVVTSFTVLAKDGGNRQQLGKVTEAIVFETIIDAKLLGHVHTVTLQVPGTITAVISPADYLLQSVDIVFDTVAFLKTMMDQARQLVKKAMKRAVKITAAYTHMKRKRSFIGQQEVENKEQPLQEQNDIEPSPFQSGEVETTANEPEMNSKDQDLLTSYPEHLRETVRQFLPSHQNIVEENIEGFPPQLAKTLKALSYGGFDEDSTSSEEAQPIHPDFDALGGSGESSESLGIGLASWESFSNSSNPRPLKKRRSKVSFALPT